MELIKRDVVYVPASETDFDADLSNEVIGLRKVYNDEGFFAKEAKQVYVLTEKELIQLLQDFHNQSLFAANFIQSKQP